MESIVIIVIIIPIAKQRAMETKGYHRNEMGRGRQVKKYDIILIKMCVCVQVIFA